MEPTALVEARDGGAVRRLTHGSGTTSAHESCTFATAIPAAASASEARLGVLALDGLVADVVADAEVGAGARRRVERRGERAREEGERLVGRLERAQRLRLDREPHVDARRVGEVGEGGGRLDEAAPRRRDASPGPSPRNGLNESGDVESETSAPGDDHAASTRAKPTV